LKFNEERYRTIVDNVGEGIGFVNAKEQFEFANSDTEKIFGVLPGGLVGTSLDMFVSPEQYIQIQKETEIRGRGKKVFMKLISFDQMVKKRTITITAVAKIDKERGFMGTYGVFRDITERKHLEEEQRLIKSRLDLALQSSMMGIWQYNIIETNAFSTTRYAL